MPRVKQVRLIWFLRVSRRTNGKWGATLVGHFEIHYFYLFVVLFVLILLSGLFTHYYITSADGKAQLVWLRFQRASLNYLKIQLCWTFRSPLPTGKCSLPDAFLCRYRLRINRQGFFNAMIYYTHNLILRKFIGNAEGDRRRAGPLGASPEDVLPPNCAFAPLK